MAKRLPVDRWKAHVLEGYEAFLAFDGFQRLRRKGLKALSLTKLLTAGEWWEASNGLMRSGQYRVFQEDCHAVGEQYGLAQWTVEMACLLRGYEPSGQPFVMEAQVAQSSHRY